MNLRPAREAICYGGKRTRKKPRWTKCWEISHLTPLDLGYMICEMGLRISHEEIVNTKRKNKRHGKEIYKLDNSTKVNACCQRRENTWQIFFSVSHGMNLKGLKLEAPKQICLVHKFYIHINHLIKKETTALLAKMRNISSWSYREDAVSKQTFGVGSLAQRCYFFQQLGLRVCFHGEKKNYIWRWL